MINMEKKKILTGWNVVDISPKYSAPVMGHPNCIGMGVHDPIQATILAIQPTGGKLTIWISVDMCVVFESVVQELAEAIAQKIPNFTRDQLIVSCTHPHTAPATVNLVEKYADMIPDIVEQYEQRLREMGAVTPNDYRRQCFLPRIAAGCEEAVARLAPTGFASALGHAVTGHCRRVRYKDGTSKMYGETDSENFDRIEGGEDSSVELLYTYDENEEIKGIILMTHCPAQVCESEHFLSADFYGALRPMLNEQMGRTIPILALCGFAGDQAPRDLPRGKKVISDTYGNNMGNWLRKDGSKSTVGRAEPDMWAWSGAVELAGRLLDSINKTMPIAAKQIVWEQEYAYEYRKEYMSLRTVTEQEALEARGYEDQFLQNYQGTLYDACMQLETSFRSEYTAPYYRWVQQRKCPVVEGSFHFMRIGDCAFVTWPLEPYLSYGHRIRARVSAEHVFPVQLTAGGNYLPTYDAEKAGGYSANIMSQDVATFEGDHLTALSIAKLNSFFE